jgi:hypothetical protein
MSVPYYLQRGVAAQDGLILQTPAGAFTTGKVNADFTKQLTLGTAGNQTVTGITVTEIDATNNPGVYAINISNSSIPAASGVYILKVYLTADPIYSFEQIYVVTSTGAPGATGPITFTSVTNDGRVTDGVVAVSGATVYLSKASVNFSISTETDATGNWSSVFDASFGTVNILVVKSGYAQVSGTLTIGASTATGPGSDLALSAVSGGDTISASEFWAHLRRMSGNKTGTQADARIIQAGNDALDQLAKERDWSWYLRRGYLSINAPYQTGTVAITQGSSTATLTGGTWPTWAAKGKLYISSSTPAIDVLSRNSATGLTLEGAWNNASVTGANYVLFQDAYTLPVNLFRFGYILPGQNWGWGGAPSPIENIWRLQNVFTTGNSFPAQFGIAQGEVVVYPYPSQAATFAYTYRARPQPLASSSDIIDIDPAFKEVLWKAGSYQIAIQFGDCVAGDAKTTLSMYQAALDSLPSNEKTPVELPGSGDPMAGWPIRGGNGGHLANRWY